MITRRRLLQLAVVCGAPVAVGSVVWNDPLRVLWFRVARRLDGFVRSPEARLRAHFEYLNLDPGSISQFFLDYERLNPNFSRRSPLPPDVYTRYLLSTNFFQAGADQSREVRYVLFYDTDFTPCHNPLATFDDESSGTTRI